MGAQGWKGEHSDYTIYYILMKDTHLLLVVPNVHLAAIQRHQQPRLLRVEVHGLDAVGARLELLADVQSEAHFSLGVCGVGC